MPQATADSLSDGLSRWFTFFSSRINVFVESLLGGGKLLITQCLGSVGLARVRPGKSRLRHAKSTIPSDDDRTMYKCKQRQQGGTVRTNVVLLDPPSNYIFYIECRDPW